MVNTLIDHRSDVIKCSKLKWDHEPQASGFTAITIIFFYEKPKTKQPALRDMLPHFHGLYSHRPKLSTNQRTRIRSVIVKFYFFSRFAKRSGTLIE